MKQKVTAVFDIGKTNKKFFLFDKDFKEVHKEYIMFDEIVDEDVGGDEDDHLRMLAIMKVKIMMAVVMIRTTKVYYMMMIVHCITIYQMQK